MGVDMTKKSSSNRHGAESFQLYLIDARILDLTKDEIVPRK